jgi:tetratricopeptide (TPR) repeat protein
MKRFTAFLIACASLSLALPSLAAEKTALDTLREERDARRERYMLRTLTQNRLNTAVEFLDAGEYDKARKKLEQMKFKRLNSYERALVYRYLAFAAIGQDDSDAAVGFFEKVVEQAALTIDNEAKVRFTIAQLYASKGDWPKVESTLNAWFEYVEKPNGVAYYLLAISRYRRELYDEALTPGLKALEITPRPRESWYQLVAALHLQKEDYDSATGILENLVTRFPKKQYWVQLSLIYSARGNYEHALRIQQLAYAQDLLTENGELRRLARTFLFHQLPYSAALVLERGLDEKQIDLDREVLELLGNSWIAAREYDRAIDPLQIAADMAEDGRLYLRLGQVRVQREDWSEATQLIQKAITKGGLKDAGKAHLLLGISYYSDDHPESARTAFRLARKHESTETDAKAWLDHIARQSGDG